MTMFEFETDSDALTFCIRIANEMASRHSITVEEAVKRINWIWGGQSFEPIDRDIRYHWLEAEWADRILNRYEMRILGGPEVQEVYLAASKLASVIIQNTNKLADQPLEGQEKSRAEKAIGLLSTVVHFNQHHWPALWLMGKLFQRLRDYETSLIFFSRAISCSPNNGDVFREASISALELGRIAESVEYATRATEIEPNEPGLVANLALVLLVCGKVQEAAAAVELARVLNGTDTKIKRLAKVIRDVAEGKRECPTSIHEL